MSKTKGILWLCFFLGTLIYIKNPLFAQNFEMNKSGQIEWETKGTGNDNPGYHYHTIGWKFTITQTAEGRTKAANTTVYMGNADSSSKAYRKSGGLVVKNLGAYETGYVIAVDDLSESTGLEMKKGIVVIQADAVIEFTYVDKNGKRTSKHISTTKSDANQYCKKYGFRSDFSGSYTGYYGLMVRQRYYCLTISKTTGIKILTKDNQTIEKREEFWLKQGEKTVLKATEREGFSFQTWKGLANEDNPKMSIIMPAKGMDVQAVATPHIYVLTLEGNGGKIIRPDGKMNNRLLEKYDTAWGYYSTEGEKKFWGSSKKNPHTGFSAEREGYSFQGFFTEPGGGSLILSKEGKLMVSYNKFLHSATLYAHWIAKDNTRYQVKHWIQKVDKEQSPQNATNYSLKDTESKAGTTGAVVSPAVKNYEGFTAPGKKTFQIKADGSGVLNYYYTRNSYEITLIKGAGVTSVFSNGSVTTGKKEGGGKYRYGEKVAIHAVVSSGYLWKSWYGGFMGENPKEVFVMGNKNIRIRTITEKLEQNTPEDEEIEIEAKDRYFSLQDAQTGKITYEELLKDVYAYNERNQILTEENCSLELLDYQSKQYLQLQQDAKILQSFRARNKLGKTAYRRITVHIVDTTARKPEKGYEIRFISKEYVDKSALEGGLRENSIWKREDLWDFLCELLKK